MITLDDVSEETILGLEKHGFRVFETSDGLIVERIGSIGRFSYSIGPIRDTTALINLLEEYEYSDRDST